MSSFFKASMHIGKQVLHTGALVKTCLMVHCSHLWGTTKYEYQQTCFQKQALVVT